MEEPCKEVVVMPDRLLGSETSAKLLESLQAINGVRRIDFHSPSYERIEKEIGGQKVGIPTVIDILYIEIENEKTVEEIRNACDEVLPFYYNLKERILPRPVRRGVKDLGVLERR
jgi:methyl coenzyme M reductase subunit D